jgi:hypothetical protein
MPTVHKFPIEPQSNPEIEMPVGAKLLAFQAQHDVPTLWALVDPDAASTETRRFVFVGTGHPIPDHVDSLKHVGTCQLHGGSLIFHLFEKTKMLIAAGLLAVAVIGTAHAQFYNDPRPPASQYDNPYDPNPGWTAYLHDQTDAQTQQFQQQFQQQQQWRNCNVPGAPDFGRC